MSRGTRIFRQLDFTGVMQQGKCQVCYISTVRERVSITNNSIDSQKSWTDHIFGCVSRGTKMFIQQHFSRIVQQVLSIMCGIYSEGAGILAVSSWRPTSAASASMPGMIMKTRHFASVGYENNFAKWQVCLVEPAE